MSCAGSDGSTHDKQENAADTEKAGDELPLIGFLVLALKLGLELEELLLLLILALVEPASVNLRTGHKQAAEEGEYQLMDLHGYCGLGVMKKADAPLRNTGRFRGFVVGGLLPAAALIEEFAAHAVHPRRRNEISSVQSLKVAFHEVKQP